MRLFLYFFLLINFSTSAQNIDSLIHVVNQSQNDSLKSVIYRDLGVAFINSDSCMYYFNKGIEISISSNLPFELANIYFVVGVKKHRSNLLDSALYYYSKSVASNIEAYAHRDKKLVDNNLSRTYYSIGISCYIKGDYQCVTESVQNSLRLRLAYDNQASILSCYNMLGISYTAQDEFDKAEKCLSDGLEVAINISDTVYMSNFYSSLGSVYINKKQYQKGYEYFQIVKMLSKNYSNEELLSLNMNIGTALKYLKRYDEAKEILEKGVRDFEKTNDTRGKIISLNLLAELYIETKEWKKLEQVSEKSLEYLEILPMLEQKKFASFNLSIALEKLGNPVNALKQYKNYTAFKDSIFNQQKSKEIDKLEAEFELEQNQRKIGKLTEENLMNQIQIAKDRNVKFGLLALVIIVILIFIIYRRQQERKKQNITIKKMEIEQRMLRSQMNPHFIFNALNSIQSYITRNHTYEAEVFLSKFSKLIRNILEHSTHQYISIDDEIEMLKLYLELEKIRFIDKFDFEIDNQLTDFKLMIPPMLIQPFVENAILHGMKGKPSKGNISVRFTETEDDMVVCEIEDDGVGRKLKTDRDGSHNSLATKLTTDRIQFFNQDNNQSFVIEIIDKKEESGMATGTKVILKFEMIFSKQKAIG